MLSFRVSGDRGIRMPEAGIEISLLLFPSVPIRNPSNPADSSVFLSRVTAAPSPWSGTRLRSFGWSRVETASALQSSAVRARPVSSIEWTTARL